MNILDNRSVLGSLLLLLFTLFYLQQSVLLPIDVLDADEIFTSRTMPIIFSISSILCCTAQLIVSIAKRGETSQEDGVVATLSKFNWPPLLALTVLMFAYAMAFGYVGFLLSGVLFLFISMLILGERNYGRAAAVSFGLVFFLWALLSKVFELKLAAGTLFID